MPSSTIDAVGLCEDAMLHCIAVSSYLHWWENLPQHTQCDDNMLNCIVLSWCPVLCNAGVCYGTTSTVKMLCYTVSLYDSLLILMSCTIPYRCVLWHYHHCKDEACAVCGPVREAIQKNHEKAKQLQAQLMLQTQSQQQQQQQQATGANELT